MSDDRRKSLIVGNLPEETVAALKDARMPTDAMGDDIVERLRAAGHNALMDEAADEIERLRAALDEAGRGVIAIRNELDRTRAERDSWKAQFESASAAASEYSQFWENHSGDFDPFGNYIPHSQIDGDLRAARAEIDRLRALQSEPVQPAVQADNFEPSEG